MKLDFSKQYEAQDMIRLIMKDEGVSAEQAVLSAVTIRFCDEVIRTGWAEIALGLWGHDDPEREWLELENPELEVEFDEDQKKMLQLVTTAEHTSYPTAVAYFLLFKMQSLGYHI